MRILVTGAAGFIGYHVSEYLVARGDAVTGVDNLNSYYDPRLKEARLDRLRRHAAFRFERVDFADREAMKRVFAEGRFDRVVHLGAQAGVRYSIENPSAYIDSNVVGFLHVLEGCRDHAVQHLVYASSSSVYGANTSMPFSIHDNVDHPISLYAATKKSNELMAHAYSHLFRLPTTGLRFFTVYGPWGRPDMALFKFARAIARGEPIDVFNFGRMRRDFTYIDDIVEGVVRTMDRVATANGSWQGDVPDPATSQAPYRVYNIGNNDAVELMHVIELLEHYLGRTAEKRMLPMQAGDVPATYANVDDLARDVGFRPRTPIAEGLRHFVDWYTEFYKVPRAATRSRRPPRAKPARAAFDGTSPAPAP
ncbi:MAG TPA: NAD-dependent epimerase [Gemmatimonadaceae bacterium]|nr:NAD-dependent epimerase [Gemmatimonadaceae bacterium]